MRKTDYDKIDYDKIAAAFKSGEIDSKEWTLVFDNDGGYWYYTGDEVDWDSADERANEMAEKWGIPNGYRDLVEVARAAGINAEWC